MVKVILYGSARVILKEKEVDLEAKTVKEVLKKLAEKFDVKYSKLKQHLIFVNEVNITKLKMYRTSLKDGDVLYFLSPASGG